jgi:hypothetical protein
MGLAKHKHDSDNNNGNYDDSININSKQKTAAPYTCAANPVWRSLS